MMSKPLVSIMIPTFNQEKYIAKAIESALKQDYENIEILIGDDYSDDHTAEIIRSLLHHPRIKYFSNPIRLGRVRNYHSLLYERAQGKWVVNMDGDDFFTDPTFISSSMAIIESFHDDDIVFLQAGHFLCYENKEEELIKVPNIAEDIQLLDGKAYVLNFNKINHFSHLATLYKRAVTLDLNFYSANILSTDMESLLRMAITGKVILVKKPVGKWIHHGSNASSSSGLRKLISNLRWIDNVSKFAITQSNDKEIWKKWRKSNYILQLTGIFTHEAKQKKQNKDKIKLLYFFWSHYKFLFLHPVFLKKTLEVLLKIKK